METKKKKRYVNAERNTRSLGILINTKIFLFVQDSMFQLRLIGENSEANKLHNHIVKVPPSYAFK